MEKIVIVDKDDNFVMEESREKCHKGDGILHRAFSAFIFNEKNELLLQKRSNLKPLWPLYWSNTCCSHPRKDESYEEAAKRRIKEEMGIKCMPKFLFKFQYSAKYNKEWSENEVCAVLISKCKDIKINIDPKEVDDFKFVNIEELKKDIQENPDKYTPWFKLEIGRVLEHFGGNKNGSNSG